MRLWIVGTVLFCSATLAAQTMVEAGKLAGAASGASGSVSKIGSNVSKIFGNLEKNISGKSATPQVKSSEPVVLGSPASRSKSPDPKQSAPAPKPLKADFDSVTVGLSRTDLIAKVGPPSFSITSAEGETLSYSSREGAPFTIRINDGKVAEIHPK